jgi:hypothetical protein
MGDALALCSLTVLARRLAAEGKERASVDARGDGMRGVR